MHSDVLIAGGGPAGAAAARLLALWGHRVRLVTPAATPPTLAESLPPSCGKLFDVLGVRHEMDAAGFVRSTGNTVWWESASPRIESFAASARGWQVSREALAATLMTAATQAGVAVENGRLTPDAIATAPESIVLDCTGRAGVVAKARGWRVYEPALRTVALVGAWRRPEGWPVPDSTHTLIESYADGWAWSVPLSNGTRHVAVMVDPRSTDLAKSLPSRAVYLAEIAKTREFASLTRDARFEGGAWGWDASMYWSASYAEERVLLVGDAGSFIDPLSSAGVKKALASGWLAAVATHTALLRPAMRETAFDFFATREREMYQRFRDLTQRFLGEAAAGQSHPFWTDRSGALGPSPHDLSAEALRADPDVQAAFERIRAASALRVHRAGHVRIEPRPAVNGCEIVLEPRLIVPHHADGIRYISDVDVVALVELAPTFADVGDLLEAYTRQRGPVALPEFLLTLATLVAKRWLVDR